MGKDNDNLNTADLTYMIKQLGAEHQQHTADELRQKKHEERIAKAEASIAQTKKEGELIRKRLDEAADFVMKKARPRPSPDLLIDNPKPEEVRTKDGLSYYEVQQLRKTDPKAYAEKSASILEMYKRYAIAKENHGIK